MSQVVFLRATLLMSKWAQGSAIEGSENVCCYLPLGPSRFQAQFRVPKVRDT